MVLFQYNTPSLRCIAFHMTNENQTVYIFEIETYDTEQLEFALNSSLDMSRYQRVTIPRTEDALSVLKSKACSLLGFDPNSAKFIFINLMDDEDLNVDSN